MQKFFYWLVLIFFWQAGHAQYAEKDFIRYTVKDGLTDNYITCLQQDEQGYIWIGTDEGINRFDGNSFKKFYQGGPLVSLASNSTRNLKLFNRYYLGILGKGGLQLLDTRNYSIHNYAVPDTTAFISQINTAWDAVELPGHSIGLTTGAGFYVFNEKANLIFRHDAYTLKDMRTERILYGRQVLKASETEYMVYTEEAGLACYNTKENSFTKIEWPGGPWNAFLPAPQDKWNVKYQLNDHQFLFIPYYRDSIIFYDHAQQKRVASPLPFSSQVEFNWQSRVTVLNDSLFAINGGTSGYYLFHLDLRTGHISCDEKKQFPSYRVVCLLQDRDQRLWIATDDGLYQQKKNTALINAYFFPSPTGKIVTGGFSTLFLYNTKLYAGRYSQYKGLEIIDPVTMQVLKQIEFYGGENSWNEIISIEMYYRDTIWLGTSKGLLWLDTKTDNYGKVLDEKKYPWIATFAPIMAPARPDGYAWMCSYLDGKLIRYHISSRTFTLFTSATVPALPFDKVKSIVYDSYGDIWVGGHSLARWNNEKQLFDTLITVYGGVNKYNDDILTLSADANGSLWLHNIYNGLLEYRIREKKFIAYTANDGLPAEEIQSFSPVIDNTLWIASSNHLIKFDTRTKKIAIYDQTDGLPEQKPTGRKIYFDTASHSCYQCNNEYIIRYPFQPPATSYTSSSLLTEEFSVNNKKNFFQPEAGLALKYDQNNLSLHYTVIDFEKNKYQFSYKLNDAGNWNQVGDQRAISLTNLPPGNYTVHLKAVSLSGDEKLKDLSFVIKPPFWKTAWFIAGCAVVLISLLYVLYLHRFRQIRQKANIDKLLAQTEMKALHSQMNPHFIFNSLNSIREMILNNENKEASHYLSKFAQLIRMTLDQSGQAFVSLRNTLDYLHRYVEMEKIRNGHFTYNLHADPALDMDETVLPPMLIQPFIENAIWHGPSAHHKNININIDFINHNGQLVCTIDDNGVGIDQSLKNKINGDNLHNPFGIANIRNRIRLLNEKYDQRSSITITDKKNIQSTGTGTQVILRLPLEISET